MNEEITPQDSEEEPEVRRDTRVPLVAPVEIEIVADKSTVSTFTVNVSLEGLFVLSSNPKPVGTKIGFELRIQTDRPPVKGFGEVRWIRVRDEGPGHPAGMGLQLSLVIGEEGQEHLRKGIADAIKAGAVEGDPVPAPALSMSSPEAQKALASVREPKPGSEEAAAKPVADRIVRKQSQTFEYGQFAHRSATLVAKRRKKKPVKGLYPSTPKVSTGRKRLLLYTPMIIGLMLFMFVFLMC